MNNFELYNPTKIVFGKGQIEKLGDLVPKGAKVLLAYGGGSIFKNGIHDQVKTNLKGFEIVEELKPIAGDQAYVNPVTDDAPN